MPIEVHTVVKDRAQKLIHVGEARDGSEATIVTTEAVFVVAYQGEKHIGYPALSPKIDSLPQSVINLIRQARDEIITGSETRRSLLIDPSTNKPIPTFEDLVEELDHYIDDARNRVPICTRISSGHLVELRLPLRFGDASCIKMGRVVSWMRHNPNEVAPSSR